MLPPRRAVRYLLSGTFYSMAYYEWGSRSAPPVVCVHGLTRTGRDFDALAAGLADRFHVISVDLPGRGASDWLPDAWLYEPPNYVIALAHLLAAIGRPVRWVGTSLGGLCGMLVAATLGHPIVRMVLNDIGPLVPGAAIRRIREYVGTVLPEFPNLLALETYLRRLHAGFGKLTDKQWEHLAKTSARELPNGKLAMHYDPGIARLVRSALAIDADLWPVWDKIAIPVLAIRGESSDMLLPSVLERMQRSGAEALIVPEAGHAPALMDAPTIRAVREFLLADE
jgi:pimeloyl-ACP methyl ester carboxylesterase